jgi:hypothetical protein
MHMAMLVHLALDAFGPWWKRQQRAKERMLHDGQLAQDLCDVHLFHARIDLVPRLDGRNVVEHGRMPAERGRLDRVYELDAGKVHVGGGKGFEDLGVVDGFWPEVFVVCVQCGRWCFLPLSWPAPQRNGRNW